MGEFGAIYVASGRIGGKTDTMPLRVEKLFQEYNQPAAFATASVLAMLAPVTLLIDVAVDRRLRAQLNERPKETGESSGTRSPTSPLRVARELAMCP